MVACIQCRPQRHGIPDLGQTSTSGHEPGSRHRPDFRHQDDLPPQGQPFSGAERALRSKILKRFGNSWFYAATIGRMASSDSAILDIVCSHVQRYPIKNATQDTQVAIPVLCRCNTVMIPVS